jgi:hypothetical protein
MHRLIKPIVWVVLFLVMLLAIDQFLVQVPPVNPAHAAISNFYRDFRNRMIELVFGEKKAAPESIEDVIETRQKQKPAEASSGSKPAQARAVKTDSSKSSPQRYIYSDNNGELQFADSLQEVPEKFRKQAQPIGE